MPSPTLLLFDDFDRADGQVGGGWETQTFGGGDFVVSSERLATSGNGSLAISYQPVSVTNGVTVSATITHMNGFGGLMSRYDTTIVVGNDGGFSSGYGIVVARGDSRYSDSTVYLWHDGVIIGEASSSFQFGAAIQVSFSVSATGQVIGVVEGDGNTFHFSFAPAGIEVSAGNLAIIQSFPDTRSPSITHATIDDVSVYSGVDDFVPDPLSGFRYPLSVSGIITEAPGDDHYTQVNDLGVRYSATNQIYHLGEDWHYTGPGLETDQLVYAVADGTVVYAGFHPAPGTTNGFGNVVVIEHTLDNGDVVYSLYAHLGSPTATVGAEVAAGDPLGRIGATGAAGGNPHLHFEIFSVQADADWSDYLIGGVGTPGRWAYTSNHDAYFADEDVQITYVESYTEGAFTWYNPSMFIDAHRGDSVSASVNDSGGQFVGTVYADSFTLSASDVAGATVSLEASGQDVVAAVSGGVNNFVLRLFEAFTFLGGVLNDQLQVGNLTGTTISQNTIFFSGGGGADSVDGIETDRRIVASGGDGDDFIRAGSGSDQLDGGAGADDLDGGAGIDTASYALASSGATWTRNPNGTWTVNAGAQGVDTLTSVEILHFTDRDVYLDQPANTFFGDYQSDVLLRRASDGVTAIWGMNGATVTFVGVTEWQAGSEWSLEGFGDFNSDGRDDFLLRRNSDNVTAVWNMDGTDVIASDVTNWQAGADWTIQGVADFNSDGFDDILWRRDDGVTAIWQMSGTNVIQADVTEWQAGNEWVIEGLGDFNGDGRDDFLFRRASDGVMAIWQMDGVSVTAADVTSQQAGLDWEIAGVGDFNADGRDDLLLRNGDGVSAVWIMNGTTVSSAALTTQQAGADWRFAAIGDYDGDGRDDVLLRHDSGLTAVWRMFGATVVSSEETSQQAGAAWDVI